MARFGSIEKSSLCVFVVAFVLYSSVVYTTARSRSIQMIFAILILS